MAKPKLSDRKILPDDLPRIIQLYKDGNTQTDIGLEYGVDHSTIYYYLCRAGIATRIEGKNNWRPSLKRKPSFTLVVIKPRVQKSYAQYLEEAKNSARREIMHILKGTTKHVCATISAEV